MRKRLKEKGKKKEATYKKTIYRMKKIKKKGKGNERKLNNKNKEYGERTKLKCPRLKGKEDKIEEFKKKKK